MSNIAQMVNVLQSMLLTDGPRMVRTPTYWVYDLYRPFQGATDLPVSARAPDYSFGGVTTLGLHASAARGADGVVHLALVNTDPDEPLSAHITLAGLSPRTVSGRVLTAKAMNAVNTFDAPDTVRPAPFTAARIKDGAVSAALPPMSIVVLDLR
jgi:alpha-N-arabinofuranosidase